MSHAFFSMARERIRVRPADQNCFCAEGQGFENVCAVTNSAIEEHSQSIASRFNDVGQRVESTDRAVSLASTVVRYDDAFDPMVRGL